MSLKDWTTFECDNPDFVVRSVPDNVTFKVNRAAMSKSEVFQNMFSFGQGLDQEEGFVDLHETSTVLIALLRLLHCPLTPPVVVATEQTAEQGYLDHKLPKRFYDPSSVIPLPILISLLYNLVDKYAIPDTVTLKLNDHLLAHAPAFPLPVYGFATLHRLDSIASQASQYLQPLASYTEEEVAVLPTIAAYHKVVRLQALRSKELRDIVLCEDIFPHGYGACPSHEQVAVAAWKAKRLALATVVETTTDISGEMEAVSEMLPQTCTACQKACTAAVQMLAYKSKRVIKRVDQLPGVKSLHRQL